MLDTNYYTIDEAVEVSGISKKHLENYIKVGKEVSIEKKGRRNVIIKKDFESWLDTRKSRLVSLNLQDYIMCLEFAINSYYAYKSTSDFGTTTQRDAGKFVSNFVIGKLGEIAVYKFLKSNFDIDIKLDFDIREAVVGQDITEIAKPRRGGKVYNPPKQRVAIKTTKFKNVWLVVPQKEVEDATRASDIYILTRVDLPMDHMIRILREHKALEKLKNVIPDFGDVKAEICGFTSRTDLQVNTPVSELPNPKQEIQPSYIMQSGIIQKNLTEWEKLLDQL